MSNTSKITSILFLATVFVTSFVNAQGISSSYLAEDLCTSNFNNEVKTYSLSDYSGEIGYSIWLDRKSQKVKAKYFAYKDVRSGQIVQDKYDTWRSGRNVILMSSGAYASGWRAPDAPTGITVDNGVVVNKAIEPDMDGLVIVEEVGGIRVSNIEDRDLSISTDQGYRTIDVVTEKMEFLAWCEQKKATVFQTHLLVYKDALKVGKFNSADEQSVRKVLVLAKDRAGNLFHIIYYPRYKAFTLYTLSEMVLRHLNATGYSVIAAINLDTGGYDVLSTAGSVKDCEGQLLKGNSNQSSEDVRKTMTNILAYYYAY